MGTCPTCEGVYPHGQFCPTDGTRLVAGGDAAAGEDALVGRVVADRFRIVGRLGEGGMGTVYEARHLVIDKRVALKLLRPEITASPEAVMRFQREARAASTIGHPNIVAMDDFGRLPDGQVYLTMEYLEGQPLSELVARGPLDPLAAVDIAIQVAHGLAAAHAKGIVHRDMKAANVFLLEGSAQVKILDFGVAKVSAAEGREEGALTRTGVIFGTPNYMAPEQALGRPVDHRADIYSLGVMLYEMLTGAVPFVGDSFMVILTQHVTAAPERPSLRSPGGVAAPLEALVLKALAKDPSERYDDMKSMVAALTAVRAELFGAAPAQSYLRVSRIRPPLSPASAGVQPASTPTAGELLPRPPVARGRRGVAAVVGGATLVLVVGLGMWFARGRGPASVAAPALPAVAVARVDAAGGATPKGARSPSPAVGVRVRLLVASEPSGAAILREGRTVGQTPEVGEVDRGLRVTLVLRRGGYADREVRVVAGEDRKLTVALSPARSSAPAAEKLGGGGGAKRLRGGRRPVRPHPAASDDGSDHGPEPETRSSRPRRVQEHDEATE